MSENSMEIVLGPEMILEDLRWRADQAIINPFGESVWLKKIPEGITDCCFTDSPCERHVIDL